MLLKVSVQLAPSKTPVYFPAEMLIEPAERVAATNVARKRLTIAVNDGDYLLLHHLPMIEAAEEAGFEVHIAGPEGDYSGSGALAGRSVHFLPFHATSKNPLRLAQSVLALRDLYCHVAPDVAVHLGLRMVAAGSVAANFAGKPKVLNAVMGLGHLATGQASTAKVQWIALLRILKASCKGSHHHFLFQNEHDQESFAKAGISSEERTHLSKGVGVDLSHFDGITDFSDTPTVILPARLLNSKGVHEFVDAARLVKARSPNVRFAIVGALASGHPDAVSESVVEGWIDERSIEWWGHRQDMPQVIGSSHIVCLPSHGEGLPRVLCEAAAMSIPVVTTDTPGCRDAVADGTTGLLVKPYDAVGLAAALNRLLDSATLRKEMGQAARTHAEANFDVNDAKNRMGRLFSELSAA